MRLSKLLKQISSESLAQQLKDRLRRTDVYSENKHERAEKWRKRQLYIWFGMAERWNKNLKQINHGFTVSTYSQYSDARICDTKRIIKFTCSIICTVPRRGELHNFIFPRYVMDLVQRAI
jgi:radical SAM superfamily enzyme